MTDVVMPRLSDSVQEGTVLKWLKLDGDYVRRGEELVELETDKATMTHTAEADGILTIVADEGVTVTVGELIACLADEHDQVQSAAEPGPSLLQPSGPDPTETSAGQAPADLEPGPAPPDDPRATRDGPRATPLARRVARIHDIDLAGLPGTGPGGRITKSDVAAVKGVSLARPRPAALSPSSSVTPASPSGVDDVVVEAPTRLQKVVARRMAQAKATIPDFQVQAEVEMDELLALRAQLKALAGGEPGPSINDFIVRACALALLRYPRANGSYRDGSFELHRHVNIGIAVASENALVVPTIFDADSRSLSAIAAESRRLAQRARAGSITPPEVSGATFTVSNLGMYGMTAITPIINPPQAAILGVGSLRELAGLTQGTLVARQLVTLTLSSDHRILYGAEAAGFLGAIRDQLEQPLALVL